MRRVSLGMLIGTLIILAAMCGAQAASRGLSVELRASETKDAPVAGKVKLYGASHALVIGNDAYSGAWPRLSNAVKDARLVAEALRAKGFEVTLKTNLKHREMVDTFASFYLETGDDPEARLFVWYAGHGYSERGESYLIPVDGLDPSEGGRFRLRALSLRRMGEYVRDSDALHILSVFDSCFAGTIFNISRGKPPPAITRATTRPVRQFLTSGGAGQEVPDDGTFRKVFIRAIKGENRADANRDGYLAASELGLFMTNAVTNYSNGRQTPRNGKLNDGEWDQGDFVFQVTAVAPARVRPRLAPEKETVSDGVDKESQFWDSIKDSKDADSYQAYLEQYPKGSFAPLARVRIKRLKVVAITPPKFTVPSPATPAVGVYPKEYQPGNTVRDCDGCPEMVVIPLGVLQMGDPIGDGDENPVHEVRIDYRFAVGKFEVTFAEWDKCVSDNACGGYRPDDEGWGRERRPVIRVNWDNAQTYVSWLGRVTGESYRLLSESEWEYAARAGATTTYSWGDSIGSGNANCDNCGSRWDNIKTSPVGSFPPNGFGLHDMHGNVWEWVEDCWHKDYRNAPHNGAPRPVKRGCDKHTFRGGAWYSGPRHLRITNRDRDYNNYQNDVLGFRVARTIFR